MDDLYGKSSTVVVPFVDLVNVREVAKKTIKVFIFKAVPEYIQHIADPITSSAKECVYRPIRNTESLCDVALVARISLIDVLDECWEPTTLPPS